MPNTIMYLLVKTLQPSGMVSLSQTHFDFEYQAELKEGKSRNITHKTSEGISNESSIN